MKTFLLNGKWKLKILNGKGEFENLEVEGDVPGSVYNDLLAAEKINDPYWRDNELEILKIMDYDFEYSRTFEFEDTINNFKELKLVCKGLDTISEITVNGQKIGSSNNMHRTYEFELKDILKTGTNEIKVILSSPVKYIKEANKEFEIGGTRDAMKGFPHLRKTHCMFGWDWGPRLPDAGIWRDIYIIGIDKGRINDVYIKQNHIGGKVSLSFDVDHYFLESKGRQECRVSVTSPKGKTLSEYYCKTITIDEPQLWFPNGYGEQPLYHVLVELLQDGIVVDTHKHRIGLCTKTVLQEKDQWGESFCHVVNGIKIFAMGADYIPEDNIFPRINKERTRELLEKCIFANFNAIRVWGGGYYPDDYFYDICDELGLLVWQDFNFACAVYRLTEEFEENIIAEVNDTVKRIRNHVSLGIWCGNNEIEMLQLEDEYNGGPSLNADYIKIFEYIFPKIVKKLDPQNFYWPASPSSGGGFDRPNDSDYGDAHYWDVWHGNKPFSEYRKFYFRYASEFGFQSFPCLKTVENFTLPEDRNIFSHIMEMHQRNAAANGKIMNYMSQTFLYPTSFENVLYASQLLQAEAIKYGVEHFRRNRGRCMGAIYWQLNDCWPVASWSSIDYFGRLKALHYFAKRFFAPIMLSCCEEGEMTLRPNVVDEPHEIQLSARLNIANETLKDVSGNVKWAVRDNFGLVIKKGEYSVNIPSLTSLWFDDLTFSEDEVDIHKNYFSYDLYVENERVSGGTVLFCAPKHFQFIKPKFAYSIDENILTITSDVYAKGVEIDSPDNDFILSDNYLDINAETIKLKILKGNPENIQIRSVFDIR